MEFIDGFISAFNLLPFIKHLTTILTTREFGQACGVILIIYMFQLSVNLIVEYARYKKHSRST